MFAVSMRFPAKAAAISLPPWRGSKADVNGSTQVVDIISHLHRSDPDQRQGKAHCDALGMLHASQYRAVSLSGACNQLIGGPTRDRR